MSTSPDEDDEVLSAADRRIIEALRSLAPAPKSPEYVERKLAEFKARCAEIDSDPELRRQLDEK